VADVFAVLEFVLAILASVIEESACHDREAGCRSSHRPPMAA
jgi:hypothetical protein